MKYLIPIVLFISCNTVPEKPKAYNIDSMFIRLEKTRKQLDTQLLVAKFNNLEIDAIGGLYKYRNINRDSLFYYLGKADGIAEGRRLTLYSR